jgi:hypothetical protein
VLEKTTKKGTKRYCANAECGYRADVQPPTPPTATEGETRVAQ